MPRFAANLTMMFTEWPFLDRFAAAAEAGFEAVEFLFPYEHAAEEIAIRLERNGLVLVNFNMPPGDWAAGDRGMAAIPGREDEFRAGVETALVYARATGVPRIHAMAGLISPDDADAARTYAENLRHAGARACCRRARPAHRAPQPARHAGLFPRRFRQGRRSRRRAESCRTSRSSSTSIIARSCTATSSRACAR